MGAIVLTILHLLRWKLSTTTKEPNTTTLVSKSAPTANSSTAKNFDWEQYNNECPEEDVSMGWASSDEGSSNDEESDEGNSSDEEPMPPAACAFCKSALISQAGLHCHCGNVVCRQSALIPGCRIKRGGIQCECGKPIGRLRHQHHPAAGPVPVTLNDNVIRLPSPDRLPPFRRQTIGASRSVRT